MTTMTILLPLSDEHLALMPLPTGDYATDEDNLARAITLAMIPPTPEGFAFVQWEIEPPDTVFARFERLPQ